MTTRSLMLLLVVAAGCSSKTADKPAAKPVEAIAPAPSPQPPPVPADVAAGDDPQASIGGGAGLLRIAHVGDERVDFVQLANGVSTVLSSTRPDVSSVYEVQPDGEGALVVERSTYADSDVDATQVWRFRWDAAKRTLVADGHAKAYPGEELPAWVPEELRERHAGRDRFVHGEEPCTAYSDRVKTSVMLDQGVEAMLICNDVQLAAYLVVFEGDERHVLRRFETEDKLGLVQDPETGALVAIADRKAYAVDWDGTNGPGVRSLTKVPAFAKAVMP